MSVFFSTSLRQVSIFYCDIERLLTVVVMSEFSVRGELPGLGPLTINLNRDAKTNGIDVNNILT